MPTHYRCDRKVPYSPDGEVLTFDVEAHNAAQASEVAGELVLAVAAHRLLLDKARAKRHEVRSPERWALRLTNVWGVVAC